MRTAIRSWQRLAPVHWPCAWARNGSAAPNRPRRRRPRQRPWPRRRQTSRLRPTPRPGAAQPRQRRAARAAEGSTRALDEQIQDLKQQVVDLNKDLFVLEEELLFPANTQVAVFLSMDVGSFFGLDSVTLRIDNREVINYLYTPREVAALVKGGVQRLYVGNLKAGSHELVALFGGKGPNDRDYRRGASIKFEKGVGAKYLELKISDKARRQQPEFEIKDWE